MPTSQVVVVEGLNVTACSARYEIKGVRAHPSYVVAGSSYPELRHPSRRRRARRERKKPDWGNGGHGAHGTRAGRAPDNPRGPDGGTGEGARASTCGCRPDSARRLWNVAASWLRRSGIWSAFSLAFAQNQNSTALWQKRSAFRKILTLNCLRPPYKSAGYLTGYPCDILIHNL